MNKISRKFFLFVIIILSAVSFFWLISHLCESYPWYGQYQQRDPDSVLFTRLLEQSILRGEVVEKDNYGCFPYEIEHGFAPFYLYFLLEFTGLFFTLFPGSQIDPVSVAGALPVIFTWLTSLIIVLTVYKISKDKKLVFFAAFCQLPGVEAAMSGTFMKLDYDFLISFFIWSWISAGALFLESNSAKLKVIAGIIAALFLATWSGAPFFFFFTTLLGFLLWLCKFKEESSYVEFAASGMLIGGAVNLIFGFSYFHEGFLFSLTKYSLFQPLCLVVGGFFLYSLRLLNKFRNPRLTGIVILGIFSGVIFLLFRDQLLQSTGILFQKDPIHATISELISIVDFGKLATSGRFVAKLTEIFSWTVVLLPLFIVIPPMGLSAGNGRQFRYWITLMTALSIYQVRFLRWIGAGGGLVSALIMMNLWEMTFKWLPEKKWKMAKQAFIFLPLMLLFLVQRFPHQISDGNLGDHQIETYNWIARHTPVTSGYIDDKKPEYSILTYWDEGNLLSYYARRPVAVNNAMWGFKTMADIFSSEDEDSAYSLCEEYGVRYILLSTYREFDDKSYGFWPYFKNMPKKPEYKLIYETVPVAEKKEFKNWFYFWLVDHLALTPKGKFPAGSRFRVIFAAKAGDRVLAPYILFERVKGARFEIRVTPETEVVLSLELTIGTQPFAYKIRKTADNNGKLSFVLPYSNSYRSGRVETDSFYKLAYVENGNKVHATLKVDERDVLEGRVLQASALEQVKIQ